MSLLDKSFGARRITKDGGDGSPRTSSLKISSRTWVPSWCKRGRLQDVGRRRRRHDHRYRAGTGDHERRREAVAAGTNPTAVRRGIDLAVAAVVAELQLDGQAGVQNAEIAQVGSICANGDTEIGTKIAEAMKKVGNDGVITVEESRASRPSSMWSKACSSTAVISRRTSSPTPTR